MRGGGGEGGGGVPCSLTRGVDVELRQAQGQLSGLWVCGALQDVVQGVPPPCST